jgi:hypothetical protein
MPAAASPSQAIEANSELQSGSQVRSTSSLDDTQTQIFVADDAEGPRVVEDAQGINPLICPVRFRDGRERARWDADSGTEGGVRRCCWIVQGHSSPFFFFYRYHARYPLILIYTKILDENNAEIEDIINHVEKMNEELATYTAMSASNFATTPSSAKILERLRLFTECVLLTLHECVICMTKTYRKTAEAKASASTLSKTRRTLIVRLADAERASEELKGVWEEIQRAYLQLIVRLLYY